jgi:DNA-directed RNA polymerase specialized sigma24 family protein
VPNLRLHDVEDVAGLLAGIVRAGGLNLSYHDREDLEAELLVFAWRLAEKYDPARGSFSNYLFRCARLEVVDWQRRRFRTVWKFKTHTYTRPRPKFVSLDTERDSIGKALGTIGGDSAAVWDEACRRLFEARDRERVQDLDRLGIETA